MDFGKPNYPKDNVMIVDALNLAFRWKHMGSTTFKTEMAATIASLAKSYNSGTVYITADWGSSTFRKEIYPDYKQNRKDKYETQTAEEKDAFEAFFQEYEDSLELLAKKYKVFRYKGVEADDIAAYIVRKKEALRIETIWLISSDRDWDLLVTDDVSRFSYVTRKEITKENWPYEVDINKYISYKCLIGDSGDNIPGIAGVGPKRAAQLLETYGDAFDVYDACPIPGKAKFIQSLNENKEIILTNYELMDLITYCENAIGEANVADLEWRLHEDRLQ